MLRLVFAVLTFGLLLAPSRAEEDVASAPSQPPLQDMQQLGDFTPPALPEPRKDAAVDPRGKPVDIPLPGAPEIRHRPGAGVFVGTLGPDNNVFINGSRSKATVGVRRDF